MTNEQMALMIKVFQFGFASGLTDRFEMIRQYCTGYPELESEIIDAATEFEKGCGYCHEQSEHLRSMTSLDLKRWLYPGS